MNRTSETFLFTIKKFLRDFEPHAPYVYRLHLFIKTSKEMSKVAIEN